MKKEKNRSKESKLEQLCPFAGSCAESDYGSLENCRNNYGNCEVFLKYLKEKKYRVSK